ncbi:MAG TPA: type IX secretion system membrane protein PorP/SprF [Cyclobacteriaceae bacterium]|nr:type IX secretion system membrane protein PorP/SprF [Cyclobacteriaceae bacterium]
MKKILLLAFLILAFNMAYPQQQATLSQYMFNGLAINPAYAGSHEVLSASALVRFQSVGVQGAPNTQTFSAHSPLLNNKFGLGLLLVNDKIGVINQLGLNVVYAYRILFSEEQEKPEVLSFGLQAGFSSYNAKYTDLAIYNNNDPVFAQDVKEVRPNFGFGIYYYTHRFYAGLSIPHLVNNIFDSNNDFQSIVQPNPVIINSGYVITLTRFLKFKPNFLCKIVSQKPVELNFNGNLSFDDVLWVGASYKFNNLDMLAEIQLTNQFRIGYCYSAPTNGVQQVNFASHEFMINYKFLYPQSGVLTPRHF